jgi:hypothetical protein
VCLKTGHAHLNYVLLSPGWTFKINIWSLGQVQNVAFQRLIKKMFTEREGFSPTSDSTDLDYYRLKQKEKKWSETYNKECPQKGGERLQPPNIKWNYKSI